MCQGRVQTPDLRGHLLSLSSHSHEITISHSARVISHQRRFRLWGPHCRLRRCPPYPPGVQCGGPARCFARFPTFSLPSSLSSSFNTDSGLSVSQAYKYFFSVAKAFLFRALEGRQLEAGGVGGRETHREKERESAEGGGNGDRLTCSRQHSLEQGLTIL